MRSEFIKLAELIYTIISFAQSYTAQIVFSKAVLKFLNFFQPQTILHQNSAMEKAFFCTFKIQELNNHKNYYSLRSLIVVGHITFLLRIFYDMELETVELFHQSDRV